MMKVICLWRHTKLPRPNIKIIKDLIKDAVSYIDLVIPDDCIVAVSFLGSRKMRTLNKQFLNHDYLTDVICFDYLNQDDFSIEDETAIEIMISPDIALQRFNEKSVPYDYSTELVLYIIHGLLHSAGYRDKSDDEKVKMRQLEMKIILALSKKYILNELFSLN